MKVITLIGADASGKDTQIALLKQHFEEKKKKVQVITIWDSLGEFTSLPDKKSLHTTIEIFLLKFTPVARSFFLMSCLKNSLSKMSTDSDIVLLNGFFHKYWAAEMVYGVPSSLWEKNISELSKSGSIIYLQTSVESCLKRKNSWSKYEQGLAQFEKAGEEMSKEVFQGQLHRNLSAISSLFPHVITIDGNRSVDEVFSSIIKNI